MILKQGNSINKGIKKYPDKPITMAGEFVPSLIRHQLSELVRSSRSSKCNCCKIGIPLNLINFINGSPASFALPITAIIRCFDSAIE